MNDILNNLKNRDQERLISLKNKNGKKHIVFIKHSSDVGVQRNGGRRGSEYGPTTIINHFQKLAILKEKTWSEYEASNKYEEAENFDEAQAKSILRASEILSNHRANYQIFLGGGHDHAYVDLCAIKKLYPNKKIIIINLDPHTDTRIDSFFSSGTPFRQIDNTLFKNDELIQIGTEEFANVNSSRKELSHLKQQIITFDFLKKETKNFTDNLTAISKIIPTKNLEENLYFLSIDLDILSANSMEAVSAPNHRGINFDFLFDLTNYMKYNIKEFYIGLYEYNPLFENQSIKGARSLAALLYHL